MTVCFFDIRPALLETDARNSMEPFACWREAYASKYRNELRLYDLLEKEISRRLTPLPTHHGLDQATLDVFDTQFRDRQNKAIIDFGLTRGVVVGDLLRELGTDSSTAISSVRQLRKYLLDVGVTVPFIRYQVCDQGHMWRHGTTPPANMCCPTFDHRSSYVHDSMHAMCLRTVKPLFVSLDFFGNGPSFYNAQVQKMFGRAGHDVPVWAVKDSVRYPAKTVAGTKRSSMAMEIDAMLEDLVWITGVAATEEPTCFDMVVRLPPCQNKWVLRTGSRPWEIQKVTESPVDPNRSVEGDDECFSCGSYVHKDRTGPAARSAVERKDVIIGYQKEMKARAVVIDEQDAGGNDDHPAGNRAFANRSLQGRALELYEIIHASLQRKQIICCVVKSTKLVPSLDPADGDARGNTDS
ncbi:unnamed protein product (mitochondrion) [Plasmodiophora brassicae]|uniref:Uncharacterized protein n=1 Tax=Plasmodiophora brassicae TaxID=37360 RepID=A0A3P3YQ98_PLABS|nr:unnamed protein product [Plasmodiophora brassicae]